MIFHTWLAGYYVIEPFKITIFDYYKESLKKKIFFRDLEKMTRGFFVGGNWKMNGSKAMIDGICENLNKVNVPDNTRGKK